MYTSHSRRMPVILMLLPETAPEISSHKPHTEVFSLLHHHAKFPDQTEALQLYHAKPQNRTSPSSQQEKCLSVEFLIQSSPPSLVASASFQNNSYNSFLDDTASLRKRQYFRFEKNSAYIFSGFLYPENFFYRFLTVSSARYAFCISITKCI